MFVWRLRDAVWVSSAEECLVDGGVVDARWIRSAVTAEAHHARRNAAKGQRERPLGRVQAHQSGTDHCLPFG